MRRRLRGLRSPLLLIPMLGFGAPGASLAAPGGNLTSAVDASVPVADLFALRLTTLTPVHYTTRTVRARVQAYGPLDGHPCAGVEIHLELSIEGTRRAGEMVRRTATTDREGGALFDLPLPAASRSGPLTVAVTGSRRGYSRTLHDLLGREWFHALVSTDKHGYQPGQVVHIRALCFDDERRPVAGRELTLRIEGAEEQRAATFSARTSRFGIVQADWRLPAFVKEGSYGVLLEDGDHLVGRASVEVSHYQLPRFTISARPARDFTPLGEPSRAVVEVRSLLGEPVARAAVEIYQNDFRSLARSASRPVGSGLTGANGKALVELDLARESLELRGSSYGEPYRDVELVAVARHPLTAEVQRRWFRLRLSRAAIHVYSSLTGWSGDRARFIVTAFYPDGRPAACAVELGAKGAAGPPLARAWTNRFGIAKLELPARTTQMVRESNRLVRERVAAGEDFTMEEVEVILESNVLVVKVRDAAGREGVTETSELAWSDEPELTLTAPRHLLHAGEPLTVEVAATTRPGQALRLEVERNGQLLATRLLPAAGHQSLVFPYQPAFRGLLGVHLYPLAPLSRSRVSPSAELAVLYPDRRRLVVEVKSDRERSEGAAPVYEEDFLALGDRGWPSIAGWTVSRLRELDPHQPFPHELDLVAEALIPPPPPLGSEESTPLAASLRPHLGGVSGNAAWTLANRSRGRPA